MEQVETPLAETANKYELMVIFLPDLGEEAIKKELAEINKLLLNDGGNVYHEDVWELKDLAYRIKNQDKGYYVVLNFSLKPDKITEVENFLNIHQTILRYLIVKTPFNYEIKTLKNYEAEKEKLDKEEQKAKNDAAPRKIAKVRAPRTSRSDRAAATEAKPKERRLQSEEEVETKTDEAASAPKNAETAPSTAPEPKTPKKKTEKGDLDDFDKKLKSIIDDPDISL